MWLSKNKPSILLGVSGGIAAYKAPEIVRSFVRAGWEVETILTEGAEAFVSPLALSTLSGHRVWRERDFLDPDRGFEIPHISLAEGAAAVVAAPCTANVLRQAAGGESGTLLGAALLATRAPVLLFPAMNSNMWEHPATQAHAKEAVELGYQVIEPDSGDLACGAEGPGRMPDPSVIVEWVARSVHPKKDLLGRRLLITAGPTWEFLDPVRFLGNPSTGRMGYALARAAFRRGAEVMLISGPSALPDPVGVEVRRVVSALEMRDICLSLLPRADAVVKAAAVGDYRAVAPADRKMKRRGSRLEVELIENPDIAAELGRAKRPDQVLVGFAAETEELLANARGKMAAKNLDLIAANDLGCPGAGFAVETNRVHLLSRDGSVRLLEGSKEDVAEGIWDAIAPLLSPQG
jgi:phosphopantothenoylcysteine decarboxylase/phosphopantothenate--cysteine ligase